MHDAVLISLITSGAAVFSGMLSGLMASRLTVYRINQLEIKVDKHNCLVERMVVVEQSTKSAHHRLDELARKESA